MNIIKNILITGVPKSGKSTLLEKVISNYQNKVGFITKEILNENVRIGFEINTNKNVKSVLASINFNTPHKVSKHFVDIKNLDNIIPQALEFSEGDILYLDEIGQMQLFSDVFKEFVEKYFNSENIVLATISAVYQSNFIDLIKSRKDVHVVEVSEFNRKDKEQFVIQLIRKIGKAKKYIDEPKRFKHFGNNIELKSEHGIRLLTKSSDYWNCDCNFYSHHNICSHAIATQALYEN